MTHPNTLRLACLHSLLWLLCCLVPAWASAQALTVTRAEWLDVSGQTDITAVPSQSFQPAAEVVSKGYTPAHLWLRVTVPPTQQPNLLVVVKPTYLDSITLYSRPHPDIQAPLDASGLWQVRQQGDLLPFASRERNDLFNTFNLYASPSEPTVFYVRVHTTSYLAVQVTVSTQRALENEEQLTYMGIGMYSGLVLLISIFSVYRWVIGRDALWGLNALVQATSVLMVLVYMGFTLKHVSPESPGWWGHTGTSVLVCVTLFLLMLYYRQFTAAFQAPGWLVGLLSLSLLTLPFQIWLISQGQVRAALQLNSVLLVVRSFAGLGIAFLLVIEDKPLRYMIRSLYFALAIYGPWFALPLMGVGEVTEAHLYPPMGNLISAAMQILVLSRRDWLLQREKEQLEQRVQRTEEQLRWEQQRLAQSASFMGMLLHELKNPLASIRLLALAMMKERPGNTQERQLDSIHQSVDNIDAVLERCRQVDQIEQGQWTESHTARHNVAALLRSWANLRPDAWRLTIHSPEQLWQEIDADMLKIMAGNLIDNALAYSPAGSQVSITLEGSRRTPSPPSAPPGWTLRVCNPVGKAGVPDVQKVFTKYYRAQGAHQRTGSGLGLFLVKTLAEMAGGRLQYRTEGQAGQQQVIFELHMPASQ